MHILQLLPRLEDGPASCAVISIHHALVHRGFQSSVVSDGGALMPEITTAGGFCFVHDVHDNDPLSMIPRAKALGTLIDETAPDLLHFHGRVPGWIATFANRSRGLPVISTIHRNYPDNAFSEVMFRADNVILGHPENHLERSLCSYEHLTKRRLFREAGGLDDLLPLRVLLGEEFAEGFALTDDQPETVLLEEVRVSSTLGDLGDGL